MHIYMPIKHWKLKIVFHNSIPFQFILKWLEENSNLKLYPGKINDE